MTLKVIQDNPSPWYAEGLHFACTGCGQCCTGAPGYVWVNEEEIDQMARFLKIERDTFVQRYLRLVKGRFSLREHSKTYDCIFLKDKKCQLYEARPLQCRTFPWWPELLKSDKEWKDAARGCEGICKEAPLVSFETIEQQRLLQEKHNQV